MAPQFHNSQSSPISLKDFCFSACKMQEPQLLSQLPNPFPDPSLTVQDHGSSLRVRSGPHLPGSLRDLKRVWILLPSHQGLCVSSTGALCALRQVKSNMQPRHTETRAARLEVSPGMMTTALGGHPCRLLPMQT